MTRILAAALTLTLLLAGCARGPSQAERVAAAQEAWDATRVYARDADQRIQDLVIATHPELTFTNGEMEPEHGGWHSCSDAPYNDHWDSPERSMWAFNLGYDVAPRQPTVDLLEPLLQSYVDEGWAIWRDRRHLEPSVVDVTQHGFILRLQGTSQEHLDTVKESSPATVRVRVWSYCLLSPANLTEWDPQHPDDFSFATQQPPEPAG